MKKTKLTFAVLSIIGVFSLYYFYKNYQKKYKNNVANETYLFIPTGSDFEDVKRRIKNKVIDFNYFVEVAQNEDYPENIKPGKYKLNLGEGNQTIVDKLINGEQEEVVLKFQATDHISQIIEKIRQNIEADSISVMRAFQNQAQKDGIKDLDELKIYFIPNTYSILWNEKPENFVAKMKTNFDKFWTDERKEKAKKLGLTPKQVINFAAITQRESNREDEQPRIAGLYIKRYKIGMKLQSDPTVLFAKKKLEGFDKKYYRVYFADLSIDSPYNTYKYVGLPPIPICSPNPQAIDAVLNAETHDYIYMCASPTNIGYHDFTKSYAEHEANAQKYRAYLNEKNIK